MNLDACGWRFRARERKAEGGWYRWYAWDSTSRPFVGTYEEALDEATKIAEAACGQAVPVPVIPRREKA